MNLVELRYWWQSFLEVMKEDEAHKEKLKKEAERKAKVSRSGRFR